MSLFAASGDALTDFVHIYCFSSMWDAIFVRVGHRDLKSNLDVLKNCLILSFI